MGSLSNVLFQTFLVSHLHPTPWTLIGDPLLQSDPVSGVVALDYNCPFIIFQHNQPHIMYSDGSQTIPMIAVKAAYWLAGSPPELITRLPLAEELMIQQVANFLVPVSNLIFTGPVAPLANRNSTASILARDAPVLARDTAILDRNSRSPILHRDPPADRCTVKIKFAGAPIGHEELWGFFRRRLQSSKCKEHVVDVETTVLKKEASITFSGPAAVDMVFDAYSGREVLCEINKKFCWAYPLWFWLGTQNDRRAFITFSRGKAPSKAEVYGYFNRERPMLEVVRFQKVAASQVPLYAHLVFYTSAAVKQLIEETPVFTLGGKRIEVKRHLQST